MLRTYERLQKNAVEISGEWNYAAEGQGSG